MKNRLSVLIYVLLAVIMAAAGGYFIYRQESGIARDILTAEERAWLNSRPVVRLAPDPNFPPLEFFDQSGMYRGMIADYFRLIEERMDYRFEFVRLETWDEVLQQAKERQIDGITAAQITPERQQYLLFTQPIVDIPNVIIVRDNMPGNYRLEDMGGMTVAVTRGNALHEYIESNYPEVVIKPVDDDLQALLEVSFYRADATVVNLAIASYYIEKQGISNLRVAGDSGKDNPLAIATRSDEPQLNRILDKGLASLSPAEKRQIYSRWVQLQPSPLEVSQPVWRGMLFGVSVAVLLLGVLALWTITLRRRVAESTGELSQQLHLRQQAEEALKKQNQFLEALHQTSLSLLNRLDTDELLESIVDHAAQLFDVAEVFIYALDESISPPQLVVRAITTSRQKLGHRLSIGEGLSGKVWQSGEPLIIEDYAVWEGRADHMDPERTLHAVMGYPLKSGGQVIGVLGMSHADPSRRFTPGDFDWVARYAALAALALDNARLYETLKNELAARQQAEQRYRQLVEHINAVTYLDANDAVSSALYTSPQIETLLGYTVEEWLADPQLWVKLLHPDDRDWVLALNERCRASGENFVAEYRMYTRDGRVIWIHDDAVLIDLLGESEKVWHGIMYDITERKQMEAALRQAEQRYRDLIERFHAVFYLENLGENKGFVYISPHVETMLGYSVEEWLADVGLWMRVIHPEDLERVSEMNNRCMRTGGTFRMEYRMVAKDGHVVWVYNESTLTLDALGNPQNWQGIWIDITERKRSEEMLQTSQKMADLGTLAAGVAHELNSPLQIITGASEVLLGRLERGEEIDSDLLKRRLEMINQSAWRSAEIIRSLLNYARSGSGKMEYYNLNDLIREMLKLMEHQLKSWSNIYVSTELLPELPPMWCDRNQILQVLINLVSNARDAMPRPRGGRIFIQTQHDPQNGVIILKVSDTGAGIPQEIIRNIFDPFFTTKPLGQGTGLGLSIVLGIVNAHRGGIDVESQPGQGTTFTIYFPENPPQDAQEDAFAKKAGRFNDEV
ncbi:MAG: PAS domain-containing protein [Anaerolineae bacterium]|nr:PAS domain-containing protein [Anaerolineae bacterium]